MENKLPSGKIPTDAAQIVPIGNISYHDNIRAIRELIGKRMRELRINRMLTQKEMSDCFGSRADYYRSVECGQKQCSLHRYSEIAACLGVSLSDLVRYV